MKNALVRSKRSTLLGLALLLVARIGLGEAPVPREIDAGVARNVVGLLQEAHVTGLKLDDTVSERLHKMFLQQLDPLKLYFLQSDADEFAQTLVEHDNELAAGNVAFAYQVFKRFHERLGERVVWANQFASDPHKFDVEERMNVDPDTARYSKTEAEAKERWRVRVKYEIVSMVVSGTKEEEARKRIQKRYRNLKRVYDQMDSEELVELYLSALSRSFDPHSDYLSDRTLEDFKIAMRLSLEGIGALLQSEDGTTVVKEVVAGGAAARDGRLKQGDRIVGVAQGGGEIVDIVEMKLRDVVKQIRGAAGTVVRLEVIPANSEMRSIYELTRQKIVLTDNEAKGDVIETPSVNGGTSRIGVIKLPAFYADEEAVGRGAADAKTATSDVNRILVDFQKQGVDAVVMDLRTNGGGYLDQAVELTGLFIDEGPVVQVRDFNNRVQILSDPTPGVQYRGPLIVLVSKFSASASEIFAGAIQDYGRGIVIGDSTSHGKGTVQKFFDLGGRFPGARLFQSRPKLGSVKITIQKFYRVNGQSTQNRGVLADMVLPAITDNSDFSEGKLDYALPFDEIAKARYDSMRSISPRVIEQLRASSKERLETDPELRKLAQRRETLKARRERKELVFTEASLRAEKEANADDKNPDGDADDDQPNKKAKEKEKPFGTDPYTKEVVAIARDMVRLQNGPITKN